MSTTCESPTKGLFFSQALSEVDRTRHSPGPKYHPDDGLVAKHGSSQPGYTISGRESPEAKAMRFISPEHATVQIGRESPGPIHRPKEKSESPSHAFPKEDRQLEPKKVEKGQDKSSSGLELQPDLPSSIGLQSHSKYTTAPKVGFPHDRRGNECVYLGRAAAMTEKTGRESPGPGRYTPKLKKDTRGGAFSKSDTFLGSPSTSEMSKVYVSAAHARVEMTGRDSPAHIYNLPSSIEKQEQKRSSSSPSPSRKRRFFSKELTKEKKMPFLSEAHARVENLSATRNPGPGWYDVGREMQSTPGSSFPQEQKAKYAFISREHAKAERLCMESPGPIYVIEPNRSGSKRSIPTFGVKHSAKVFLSAEHAAKDRSSTKETPGPGAYDVTSKTKKQREAGISMPEAGKTQPLPKVFASPARAQYLGHGFDGENFGVFSPGSVYAVKASPDVTSHSFSRAERRSTWLPMVSGDDMGKGEREKRMMESMSPSRRLARTRSVSPDSRRISRFGFSPVGRSSPAYSIGDYDEKREERRSSPMLEKHHHQPRISSEHDKELYGRHSPGPKYSVEDGTFKDLIGRAGSRDGKRDVKRASYFAGDSSRS